MSVCWVLEALWPWSADCPQYFDASYPTSSTLDVREAQQYPTLAVALAKAAEITPPGVRKWRAVQHAFEDEL